MASTQTRPSTLAPSASRARRWRRPPACTSGAVPAVDVGVVAGAAGTPGGTSYRRSRSRGAADDADRVEVGRRDSRWRCRRSTATTSRRCRGRRPRPGPCPMPGHDGDVAVERQVELGRADTVEAVDVRAGRQRVRDGGHVDRPAERACRSRCRCRRRRRCRRRPAGWCSRPSRSTAAASVGVYA